MVAVIGNVITALGVISLFTATLLLTKPAPRVAKPARASPVSAWELLGLASGASLSDIKAAFRRRAVRKRTRDKGAMTPAIALTAFAMTRDQRASSFAGYDAHVAKPLSAQTLIETICTVCEVGNA